MIQGISGYFDITASNPGTFASRIFYSEQYDNATGKHILSVTGVSIQSKEFGGEWYPHGEILIDGEVVGTMDNGYPASHKVSLTAGTGWHTVTRTAEGGINGFKEFPWASSEIESNDDGTKQVEISVDFLLYRDSSAPRPSFKATYTLDLTPVARHYTLSISKGVGTIVSVVNNGAELEDGKTITHGDTLEINFSTDTEYKLTSHTVNGTHFESGGTYTVDGNVSVSAEARVVGYHIGGGLYHAYINNGSKTALYVAYIGDNGGKPVLYGQ